MTLPFGINALECANMMQPRRLNSTFLQCDATLLLLMCHVAFACLYHNYTVGKAVKHFELLGWIFHYDYMIFCCSTCMSLRHATVSSFVKECWCQCHPFTHHGNFPECFQHQSWGTLMITAGIEPTYPSTFQSGACLKHKGSLWQSQLQTMWMVVPILLLFAWLWPPVASHCVSFHWGNYQQSWSDNGRTTRN